MLEKLAIVLMVAVGSVVAVGLVFGWVVLVGWIIFLVYRSVAPETWITLNLWPCVGIAALLSLIFGGRGGVAVRQGR